MVFSSSIFIFVFLPVFLAVYFALPFRARFVWILLASWLFYAWCRVDFLALLLATTVWTHLLGRWIDRKVDRQPRQAAGILALGLVLNLGLLAYFKYFNFGIESLNAVLGVFGAKAITAWEVVLPVGISFYVFHACSYLIDVYRRDAPLARRYVDLAAYISLFPELMSGPIIRYKDIAGQLRHRPHTFQTFSQGAYRFMLGFCKKVLIADTVASIANSVFALKAPTFVEAWLGTAAYTMQLFFDFSGYSDMAIGLGLMLGFRFIENFNAPYLARSITEFWRRWHISLSTFLRDYLYIPLGGNRKGPARTYLNLMAVMLLGGLWHGAGWTFLLWGAWHGLHLSLERAFRDRRKARPLPGPLAVARTMLLVMIGWALFRSPGLQGAGRIFAGLIGLNGLGVSPELRWQLSGLSLALLAGCYLGVYLYPWLRDRLKELPLKWVPKAVRLRLAAPPLFLLGLLKITAESFTPFLYFRF